MKLFCAIVLLIGGLSLNSSLWIMTENAPTFGKFMRIFALQALVWCIELPAIFALDYVF